MKQAPKSRLFSWTRTRLRVPERLKISRGRWGALLYVGSSAALTVSQLIGALVVVRYVAPKELGLWNSTRLVQVYAMFVLGGLINGLGRELPFYLGKGETVKAHGLASTALAFTFLASFVVVVGGVAWAIVSRGEGIQYVAAIIGTLILVLCTLLQNYLLVTFRSSRAFQYLTKVQFAQALASIVTIGLVIKWEYIGMLTRVILVSVLGVGVLWYYRPVRVVPHIERGALKLLLRTGMPIFTLDYIKNCAATADRLVLLRMGGVELVGFYSLAITAGQAMASVPTAISQYTYSRVTHAYGAGASLNSLWRRSNAGFLAGLICCSVLAAAGMMFVEPCVMWLAPAYQAAIPAAKLALWTAVFESGRILVNVIWSLKNWRLMCYYQLASSAVLACGPFLFLSLFDDLLTAVAAGMLAASVVRAVLAVVLAWRATHCCTPAPDVVSQS